MGRFEAETLVEAVRLGSRVVRSELDPVAPELAGPLHGGAHQYAADAMAAVLGVHMHRLHLGTAGAPVLEMAEDDELADPDDPAIDLGHHHLAGTLGDLGQGGLIRGELGRILLPLDQRPVAEELHYPRDVFFGGLPDYHGGISIGRAHCDARFRSMAAS
jgi:hypothetical protein